MKRLLIFALATIMCFWPVSFASAQTSRPLDDVLEDWQGYGWSDIQDIASWEARNDGPLYPSAPAATPHYETFEGSFMPEDGNTKLAIFSDDGCDVYINGTKVHSRKGLGQALPDLSQSLLKISYSFQQGQTYRIKVEYSNTYYLGSADIDGVSLFAYSDDSAPDNGQRISKLQYSLNGGGTWADVPQPGNSAYPLTVDQGQVIDFRAVKANSALDWPVARPKWAGFVDNFDKDTAWAWFTEFSEDNNDLAVVSVECGNTISAYIKINRYYEIYVESDKSSILAGGVKSAPSKSDITATVFDWDYNSIAGVGVSLASTYEDGSTAGSIQGSVVTNQAGKAFATLVSGAKIADATIRATATMPGGKTIADEALVNFESLAALVTFGDWQPATNGQKCAVNASLTYKGEPVVGRNIRLGITVTTDQEGLQPVPGFQSQVTLSQPNGTTNSQGYYSTNVLWQKSEAPQGYFVFVTVFDDTIVE